jgi:hypothetical protein
MFIYPIYNHNWSNISNIYIYITRLVSKEIFLPSNKIHREVGRAKDFSAPRYISRNEMRPEKIPKKLYTKSWRPQSIGCFMAHSVGRRPLIAEARVLSQTSSCRICSGQSANVAGFIPSPLVFPCQYHNTNIAH